MDADISLPTDASFSQRWNARCSEDEILNARITRYYAERQLDICTNEPLEVLTPLLTPKDLQRLRDAGFKSGVMVGRFTLAADDTVRLVPSWFFQRAKKIVLAK
jgi:hypothetical protein